MRIAALVEYEGSAFSGWQLQSARAAPSHLPTVQGCIEQALSKVADEPVRVIVAGRTDAGVHACGQVIHFDTNAKRSPYSWISGANSNLPVEIALLWAGEVSDCFHARFSATGRWYRYLILNRRIRPTVLNQRVSWEYRSLEIERMREAAGYLLGNHDFTSFRAAQCQAQSPIRELRHLGIQRQGEIVIIDAYANAFLHHMVRNIAGVLMTIGAGERAPLWAQEVLHARDRTQAGMTAPAGGLYLRAVEYPGEFCIPKPVSVCSLVGDSLQLE